MLAAGAETGGYTAGIKTNNNMKRCQITKNILLEFKETQGGGGKGEKQEVEELGNEVRRQER